MGPKVATSSFREIEARVDGLMAGAAGIVRLLGRWRHVGDIMMLAGLPKVLFDPGASPLPFVVLLMFLDDAFEEGGAVLGLGEGFSKGSRRRRRVRRAWSRI